MTDMLHNHLTIGLRPQGDCPGCDQTLRDLVRSGQETDEVDAMRELQECT